MFPRFISQKDYIFYNSIEEIIRDMYRCVFVMKFFMVKMPIVWEADISIYICDCIDIAGVTLMVTRNFQVPSNFRYVVEQTLKEFFKAIQGGKDTEQSWKKSIYKVISRLDDPVPEYFKSPNFLEQLE